MRKLLRAIGDLIKRIDELKEIIEVLRDLLDDDDEEDATASVTRGGATP